MRFLIALSLLAALATWVLSREHRPSLLRPGLRLYAYVGNVADGTLSVIDLAALRPVATISVGAAPSGLRAHPFRDEIWGVSTSGGFVWVLDAVAGRVAARIPVGEGAFALDFSPDGQRAYVAAFRAGTVSLIDCATRRVLVTGRAGKSPWIARVTPDGGTLLVSNREDHTVSLLDAQTLKPLAHVPVAPRPEHIVILPDSSKAFVSAASRSFGTGQVSVVDLRRRALLANLPMGSRATDMLLKPDGGELFVATPDLNSLAIVNTQANEVAENVVVGNQPVAGAMANNQTLYLSDAASGQVRPFRVDLRRLLPPITVGRRPGTLRLTPGEDLLLVVNEESDDLAVIRTRTLDLLTLVPVGSRPRDLVIKLFESR